MIEVLLNHFFAIVKVSRPVAFETETWNLWDRDWDLQKWVLRPRPSLETPSLVQTHFGLWCFS